MIGIRQVELHLSRCAFPSFHQKISMDKELFFRKICQICKTPAPPNGKVSTYFHTKHSKFSKHVSTQIGGCLSTYFGPKIVGSLN